ASRSQGERLILIGERLTGELEDGGGAVREAQALHGRERPGSDRLTCRLYGEPRRRAKLGTETSTNDVIHSRLLLTGYVPYGPHHDRGASRTHGDAQPVAARQA